MPTQGMPQQSVPFVLFNTSLLEENNAVYDPTKINTNLLDVNFQNKIAFSTDQYFEGKMFDQNYSLDEFDKNSVIQLNNSGNKVENFSNSNQQNNDTNKENKDNLSNNLDVTSNNSNGTKKENNAKFEEPFQVPERAKRKSRFDK